MGAQQPGTGGDRNKLSGEDVSGKPKLDRIRNTEIKLTMRVESTVTENVDKCESMCYEHLRWMPENRWQQKNYLSGLP